MVVLSVCDGCSGAQIALKKAKVRNVKYYASEIEKFPMLITQKNFPKTIQLGNAFEVNGKKLPKTDLVVGGPPCQGFSTSGKMKNFRDPRSKLVYEFVRLMDETNPTYFFFENVWMKQSVRDKISALLGVKPVEMNSNLVSAQNRRRFYWTNLPIPNIQDKGIYWKDIMEHGADDVLYFSKKTFKWLMASPDRVKKFKIYDRYTKEKMQMIEASHFKTVSNQRCFGIQDKTGFRYISPLECERAQTMPDNYTAGIARTNRYKMIGEGFTIDMLVAFFKGLN